MKNTWIRIGVVLGVLGVVVVGSAALADPDLIKKDTSKCGSLKDLCTISCADSVYSNGVCRDDKTGEESFISVQCCCCTDGSNQRSFIGG